MDPNRAAGAARPGFREAGQTRRSSARGERVSASRPLAVLVGLAAFGLACGGSGAAPGVPHSSVEAESGSTSGPPSTLWIYRSDALRGSGIVTISLDGKKRGRLRDGDCLKSSLPAGRHEVRLVLETFGWLPTGWNRVTLATGDDGRPSYLHVWLALEEAPGSREGPAADFAAPGRAQRRAHWNVYAASRKASEAQSTLAHCHRVDSTAVTH